MLTKGKQLSMANFSKAYLEKTIQVWQKHYDRPLTVDDARTIASNVIGAYELLIKWKLEREKGGDVEGQK